MNTTELRGLVLEILTGIAPELDPSQVDPRADLRDELDLDSMDMLNLLTRLSERLGIEVAEADAPQLRTIDGAVAYLANRVGAPTG